MGLDPTDDDYVAGDVCADCVDVLFGGTTPEEVRVHFQDLEACPGHLGTVPDGTYKLTQTGDPCIYSAMIHLDVICTWQISPNSILRCHHGLTAWNYFFDTLAEKCVDIFFNDIIMCGFMAYAKNGKAIITWGPDDPCNNL